MTIIISVRLYTNTYTHSVTLPWTCIYLVSRAAGKAFQLSSFQFAKALAGSVIAHHYCVSLSLSLSLSIRVSISVRHACKIHVRYAFLRPAVSLSLSLPLSPSLSLSFSFFLSLSLHLSLSLLFPRHLYVVHNATCRA